MIIERHIAKGQLVPLVFGQDAVAASQTNVQIPAVGPEEGGTTDSYVMPFAGYVVAVSGKLTSAGSAGTLTVGASIDGTEDADTTITITTATEFYKVVPRDSATFVAEAEIGVEITADGSWNGTTADLNVVVWVILELEGI